MKICPRSLDASIPEISKMAAPSTGCRIFRIFLLLFILPGFTEVHGWDSIDLELFDLVEEIKDNFYDVLGLKQVRSVDIKVFFRACQRIVNNQCLLSNE